MSLRRISGVLVLASVLTFASASGSASAHAQQITDEYGESIAKALQEFELGHWTEAKVFFLRAHAIRPSARTLRGLGLACYESRNYVEAIDYLTQAIGSAVQPLTPGMRNAAASLIAEARQFVMLAHIELEPAAAELRVDGRLTVLAPDGSTLLDPGEHELSASAPGYARLRRRVNTEGGSETQLHLILQPLAAATQPLASDFRDPEVVDSGSESIGPWLLIGGSVALAATGGVLLGLGLSDKADVEGVEDGSEWDDKEPAYSRSVPFQTAGGIMLGVGVAGIAAGLAWKLWPESENTAVSLRGGGLSLRQRF
jgi:tetratricopeptide (TPR) repeat protein